MNNAGADSKCDVCHQPAKQRCGGCHNVFYCSKEHQKVGWREHKTNCKPFKVSEDNVLGRHYVATRLIKSGEVILKESALIWGPSQVTVPVCLGCGGELTSKTVKPCSKCGWPMCSEECQRSSIDNYTHIPECFYTVQRGDKVSIHNFQYPHPSYQCLTVLRCLYQRDHNTDLWKKIIKLEAHDQQRKGTDKYNTDLSNVAQFIRRFFKLEKTFTEEEIMHVCGIVQVNGHEVPLNDVPYVALYEATSMFEHNCRANCCKSFSSNGGVVISAATQIQPGEHLSICYTDPLWGTPNRRYHLKETKFFPCTCLRCTDVTEMGTYFSAMKCQLSGCKGYVLPSTFLYDPSAKTSPNWSCNQCKKETTTQQVQSTLERIGKDMAAMEKGNAKNCQKFLDYYSKLLHHNHFYLTDVRLALAQLIGADGKENLDTISDEDLQLKATLCKQVSDLIGTLVPAELRLQGVLLFELHAAIAEIGKRRTATGQSGPDELQSTLFESKRILTEAIRCLKNESAVLPEGKMAIQAKRSLAELEVVIRSIHQAVGDAPM